MKNLADERQLIAYVYTIQTHVKACKDNNESCMFLSYGFCQCQCNLCTNFEKQFKFSQKIYEDQYYLTFVIYCEKHKKDYQGSITCNDCQEIDYDKIKSMLSKEI